MKFMYKIHNLLKQSKKKLYFYLHFVKNKFVESSLFKDQGLLELFVYIPAEHTE